VSDEGYDSLCRCSEELDDNLRTVMSLKYHHGLTDGDIAELLSISKANASMRLSRARMKLKAMLKGAEGDEG